MLSNGYMRGPEGPRIFIIKLTNKPLYITRRRKTYNTRKRGKRESQGRHGQISSGMFGTLAAHGKVAP
jgi:hypothetical protein